MPDPSQLPPTGQLPVFLPNPGKTADQMRAESAAAVTSRAQALIEKMAAGNPPIEEGDATIETAAGPVRAREPVEDGSTETPAEDAAAAPGTETPAEDAAGQDNTGEPSRAQSVEAALRKLRGQAAHNRRLRAEATQREALLTAEKQRTQQLAPRHERLQQVERLARENPIEAARLLGLTAEQVAQAHLLEGTPEGKIAAMEQRLKQAEARAQQVEERAQQEKIFAERKATIEADVAQLYRLAADDKRYPNLKGVSPKVLLAAAVEVAKRVEAQYKKKGITITASPKVVAKLLNEHEDYFGKKANAEATETAAKSKAATEAPSKAKSKPTPGTASPKPVSPRTVTSSQTAGASWSRPANFKSLPQAERMKILKKQFPGT